MANKFPKFSDKHKICIICEGKLEAVILASSSSCLRMMIVDGLMRLTEN